MKKPYSTALLSAAVLLLSSLCVAETENTQTTFPKKIFVGDKIELRCQFRSAVDFFSDVPKTQNARALRRESLPFPYDTDFFLIDSVSLERNELLYTLVISFRAWQVGDIDFPAIDISKSLYGKTANPFSIDPKAITVSSLLETDELRPPVSPLFIPGTVQVLYALIFAAAVLLSIIFMLIAKRKKIAQACKRKKILRAYQKNAKRAIKKLRKLEKLGKKIDDKNFSVSMQSIIRNYMEVRFDCAFTAVTSASFVSVFENRLGGNLSDKKQSGILSLAAVMRRTDYIRYAHDSIDSKREPQSEYATQFSNDERASLVRLTVDSIERFET